MHMIMYQMVVLDVEITIVILFPIILVLIIVCSNCIYQIPKVTIGYLISIFVGVSGCLW